MISSEGFVTTTMMLAVITLHAILCNWWGDYQYVINDIRGSSTLTAHTRVALSCLGKRTAV